MVLSYLVADDREWSALLALQRATHVTLDAVASRVADLGLGAAETNVLANLAAGAARTISELSAAVGSRTTTMTSVLDRLERRGLVTRCAVPDDRRAVRIDLTPDGRRIATTIRRAFRDVEASAIGHLPAPTVAALREALDALAEVTT